MRDFDFAEAVAYTIRLEAFAASRVRSLDADIAALGDSDEALPLRQQSNAYADVDCWSRAIRSKLLQVGDTVHVAWQCGQMGRLR